MELPVRWTNRVLMVASILLETLHCLRIPTPCADRGPVNFIEQAIPHIGRLPDGVSVVYDVRSHVHALQFLPDSSELSIPTSNIFYMCQYFPEEFSVFFILKHGKKYTNNECVFSIGNSKRTIISICINTGKVQFSFNNRRVEFRNSVFKDDKWHTAGFSVTGSHVTMTTDCVHKRRRKLKRTYPSFLEISRTSVKIGSREMGNNILQVTTKDSTIALKNAPMGAFNKGLLKDIILVPGADIARRACPPRMPRSAYMDNRIPTIPEPGISSYPSVGPDWEGCKWMDVGNLAFDVYSRSIKVCVNGIWKQVSTELEEKRRKRQLDYLEHYEDIVTPAASIDVELFHIPGEGLFAVFANSDQAGSRSKGVSGLYKWVEKHFRPYQRLPSLSAQSWCYFSIGSSFYLAVANYGNDSNTPVNSTIYKWHRHRKKFRAFQSVLTYTARDMEHFTIDEEHYLAIANHAIGSNQEVDSVILKWNRKSRSFERFQEILTVGGYDWTYFRYKQYHFLAIAQAFNGKSTLMDSVIYVFQTDKFLPFQTIETNGATDWEFFSIDEDAYLVVANAYNYGPQNHKKIDTFRTNSSIYRLDISKRAFSKYQTFPTNSAIDWEHFLLGDDHYLIVSNAQNGGAEDDRLTTLYRRQGVDQFVPVHRMYLGPSADWEVFEDGQDVFFVYSNAKNRKSQVLRAKFKDV